MSLYVIYVACIFSPLKNKGLGLPFMFSMFLPSLLHSCCALLYHHIFADDGEIRLQT